MHDVLKAELFECLGYADQHDALNACLAQAGLTNARKARIDTSKQERVAALVETMCVRVCTRGDCQACAAELGRNRAQVRATGASFCEVCNGSASTYSHASMQNACRRAGWSRLCVVEGSPNARIEIRETIQPPLEVRLVDGTERRNQTAANGDIAWADHVVV